MMIDPSSQPASDKRPASRAAEAAGCPMTSDAIPERDSPSVSIVTGSLSNSMSRGVRPILSGQAVRQALKLRNSAQRLFSIQHLTANRALAPAFEKQRCDHLNQENWDAPSKYQVAMPVAEQDEGCRS